MTTTTTQVGAGATAAARDFTDVATRLAAVCDLIEEHHATGTPISESRAGVIAAMIGDVAATATEGMRRPRRRKWRLQRASSYVEVGALGAGGYGAVVRARRVGTGEDVAVKSLLRNTDAASASPWVPDAGDLLREACFAAACSGLPSHVGFRGVAHEPGSGDYLLVMEHVGPSLADAMDDRGRGSPRGLFPEAEVRCMMRQLLAGAEAMHRRGVVHRDIKAANILVGGGGGALRFCDYGLALCLAEKDPDFSPAGTAPSMAPEMLLFREEYDERVDAWALGCLMAELLTGELLFAGDGAAGDDWAADQLQRIFDVVGVPGKRAWRALKPTELTDEVRQWRARHRRRGGPCRNRLRHLFPEELLSKDGFEVLRGLLTCNPKKRLTAAAALQCPWFTTDDDVVVVPAGSAAPDEQVGSTATATTAWSRVTSCVARALALLRPKAL